MKTKVPISNHYFKRPHLFFDDLQKIEDIFISLNPKDYKLETETYEWTKVSEIPHDTIFDSLKMQIYPPYLVLSISRGSASLYVSEDNLNAIGAFKKIIEIVSERERKFWLPLNIFAFVLSSTLLIFLLRLASFQIELSDLILTIFLYFILYSSLGIWYLIYSKGNHPTIDFISKKEKGNFLIKNKDQIIIVSISAFLGAILYAITEIILKSSNII